MSNLIHIYESVGTRLGPWNYHRVWTAYLIIVSFIGALLIMCCDKITFTNAFFLTSSAVTGTGLISVAMSSLNPGSLFVILFCVFLGNGVVLLIPGLLYRQYKFRLICDEGGSAVTENRAYAEYRKIYDAIGATVTALRIYIVFFQVGGTFMYFFALLSKPANPALREGGFSQFTDAVFTLNSAFCNAGYTLTDSGLSWQAGNAFSYLVLCVVMVGGNLGTPFLFRWLVQVIVYVHHATGSPQLAVPYEYMLGKCCCHPLLLLLLYLMSDCFCTS
jgi:Trk-type K+ transport system membrane component